MSIKKRGEEERKNNCRDKDMAIVKSRLKKGCKWCLPVQLLKIRNLSEIIPRCCKSNEAVKKIIKIIKIIFLFFIYNFNNSNK